MRAGSPTCSFRSLTRSAFVAFNAGPRLKSIVAMRQNNNVIASTVASGRNFTTNEKLTDASKPRSCWSKASLHQALRIRPMTPPQTASKNPSHNNCLTICQRDAPTARRIAISLERDVPRASNMFARFKQAMSRTAPAIAMSNVAISVSGPSFSGCVLRLNRDGV